MDNVPGKRRQPARDRARIWLIQTLACGPVTVEAIHYMAYQARISWGTLQRARQGIVTPVRAGGLGSKGFWQWRLTKTLAPGLKSLNNGEVCPLCGQPREGSRS